CRIPYPTTPRSARLPTRSVWRKRGNFSNMSMSRDIAVRPTSFDAEGVMGVVPSLVVPNLALPLRERRRSGNEVERVRYLEAAFKMRAGRVALDIAALIADAGDDRVTLLFDLLPLPAL